MVTHKLQEIHTTTLLGYIRWGLTLFTWILIFNWKDTHSLLNLTPDQRGKKSPTMKLRIQEITIKFHFIPFPDPTQGRRTYRLMKHNGTQVEDIIPCSSGTCMTDITFPFLLLYFPHISSLDMTPLQRMNTSIIGTDFSFFPLSLLFWIFLHIGP